MSLKLRPYQREAIDAAYKWMSTNAGNPCIVLPTGAGKTAILVTIANDVASRWGGRVLIVSHVKELIEQAADAMARWFPAVRTTVYSAGLGQRDLSGQVVCGGVQSIADKAEEIGELKLVIVDESHLIAPAGTGRYRTMLAALQVRNSKLRIVGLTATPYRLDGGIIYGPDDLLTDVCYEAKVGDLIEQGWLSNVSSKRMKTEADLSHVKIKQGEFDAGQASEAFEAIVVESVQQIVTNAADRKSVLIFCSGVEHAGMVCKRLEDIGEDVAIITGATASDERDQLAKDFKANNIKYLVNVNVLTTGFDATCVDMVVLLRATLSPGLFYQMVGRGLRLHEGKYLCRVLDFGGNVRRHGCIDAIRPPSKRSNKDWEELVKECPVCLEYCKTFDKKCLDCGHDFSHKQCPCGAWNPPTNEKCDDCDYVWIKPDREIEHDDTPDEAPILTSQIKERWVAIDRVDYWVHTKRGADEHAPRTMRVSYSDGYNVIAEEWICVEHRGFAMSKAQKWWNRRSDNAMPQDAAVAVDFASNGHIAEPTEICIVDKPGSKFVEIVGYRLTAKPEKVDDEWLEAAVKSAEAPF